MGKRSVGRCVGGSVGKWLVVGGLVIWWEVGQYAVFSIKLVFFYRVEKSLNLKSLMQRCRYSLLVGL